MYMFFPHNLLGVAFKTHPVEQFHNGLLVIAQVSCDFAFMIIRLGYPPVYIYTYTISPYSVLKNTLK